VTRVKVCGITRHEDAELAADLGAWALGFILWRSSPRAADPREAAAIAAALRRRVGLVGVFVNATLDEVTEAADALHLSHVQLHGDEGPAFCAEAGRRTGCKVIKAIRVAGPGDLQDLERFHTDFHLLDTAAKGLRGGSGATWDWALAARRRSKVPAILSGGLTPENVAAGIAAVRPYAVDVASGVEASPGVKDHEKLRAFMAAAATPEPEPEPEPDPSEPAEPVEAHP
jgi:phosphoribosylanthranilate isomerase